MVRRQAAAAAVLFLAFVFSCSRRPATTAAPETKAAELRAVHVNRAELNYTERGSGPPIVFVHGGLADYREWLPTIDKLPPGYRAITYSRYYNFPNKNPARAEHSALSEAEDLAALLHELNACPAHVVGVSYGAYTALLLALRHPDLVKSVVAAEPPLMPWLPHLPGGQAVFDDLMSRMWIPAGDAFRAGDRERALRLTLHYFLGAEEAYDQIPAEFRESLVANIREWEALTTSPQAFPDVSPRRAKPNQ